MSQFKQKTPASEKQTFAASNRQSNAPAFQAKTQEASHQQQLLQMTRNKQGEGKAGITGKPVQRYEIPAPAGLATDHNGKPYYKSGTNDKSGYIRYKNTNIAAASRADLLDQFTQYGRELGKGYHAYFAKNGIDNWAPNLANALDDKESSGASQSILLLKGTHNPGGGPKSIEIEYNYAKDYYGYITRVQDEGGKDAEISHRDPLNDSSPGKVGSYSNQHGETKDRKLLPLMESGGFEQKTGDSKTENEDKVDALTKVVAEGARWDIIQEAKSFLSNDTFLYAYDPPKNRGIKFVNLWKTWKAEFDMQFGISNDELASRLKSQTHFQRSGDGDAKVDIFARSALDPKTSYPVYTNAQKNALQQEINRLQPKLVELENQTQVNAKNPDRFQKEILHLKVEYLQHQINALDRKKSEMKKQLTNVKESCSFYSKRLSGLYPDQKITPPSGSAPHLQGDIDRWDQHLTALKGEVQKAESQIADQDSLKDKKYNEYLKEIKKNLPHELEFDMKDQLQAARRENLAAIERVKAEIDKAVQKVEHDTQVFSERAYELCQVWIKITGEVFEEPTEVGKETSEQEESHEAPSKLTLYQQELKEMKYWEVQLNSEAKKFEKELAKVIPKTEIDRPIYKAPVFEVGGMEPDAILEQLNSTKDQLESAQNRAEELSELKEELTQAIASLTTALGKAPEETSQAQPAASGGKKKGKKQTAPPSKPRLVEEVQTLTTHKASLQTEADSYTKEIDQLVVEFTTLQKSVTKSADLTFGKTSTLEEKLKHARSSVASLQQQKAAEDAENAKIQQEKAAKEQKEKEAQEYKQKQKDYRDAQAKLSFWKRDWTDKYPDKRPD